MVVSDLAALTVSPEILQAIAAGNGPRRSLFALGYAGWAADQLEDELAAGAWVVVEADEALLFDDQTGTMAARVRRRGIDLYIRGAGEGAATPARRRWFDEPITSQL